MFSYIFKHKNVTHMVSISGVPPVPMWGRHSDPSPAWVGDRMVAMDGKCQSENDWAIAAEKTGNALLEINPDLLIIVGGILSNGKLVGVLTHPINQTLASSDFFKRASNEFFINTHFTTS